MYTYTCLMRTRTVMRAKSPRRPAVCERMRMGSSRPASIYMPDLPLDPCRR